MAHKVGDIVAPLGKYIKDGEEKTRWGKCGALIQTDKGMRIKLDLIPVSVGEQGMWLSVFEDDSSPQQKASTAPAASQAAPAKEPDVPF